ncbi:aminotransferase class IV, partial [Cribrihabitans sp. XS_ASV171]
MSRIVFLNGEYLPEQEAKISIFDRGNLMGDAVYESTTVLDGKVIEFPAHMRRLDRSMAELEIPAPMKAEEILAMHRELIARNGLEEGLIYLQVSRGPADRDFPYPEDPTPTIFAFTQAKPWRQMPFVEKGLRVISVPDGRWARRDIKTVQILWASMSKMRALRAGVDDVLFVEDGYVTESSAANAFIIAGDRIVTRPLSDEILH